MPREIPSAPKIYTTTYANFKGVDFTNDPSNVWYRRTPDGVNMLPDESGRPFKRTGWKVEVSASDIADLYASDNSATAPSEIDIRKCYYFELSGEDHIFIFTNYGVFFYREGALYSSKSLGSTNMISYDQDMIDSFDRAFFFEGGGKSAFYIYGGFKIWEYSYEETVGFKWQPVEPYIPCVNISVDARHEVGESYEAINMLSDYIAETFQNNMFSSVTGYSTTVSGATVTVNETAFLAMLSEAGSYVFTYTDADHTWLLAGDQVQIGNYGISLNASPVDGNTITVTVTTATRINLPKRVLSITGMKVFASTDTAYDTELTLQATETHTSGGYVTLVVPSGSGNSYLKFYQAYMPLVDGEDAIKVIYPRNAVTSTTHATGEITINVGA
jgi:hypothetical protein